MGVIPNEFNRSKLIKFKYNKEIISSLQILPLINNYSNIDKHNPICPPLIY